MHCSTCRKAASALVEDTAPVELWCTCQQPEANHFMICCDVQGNGCKVWYHADCVRISKSQGKRMERNGEEFVCPVCMSAGDLEAISEVNSAAQLPVMSDPSFDTHGTDFVQQISSAYDIRRR